MAWYAVIELRWLIVPFDTLLLHLIQHFKIRGIWWLIIVSLVYKLLFFITNDSLLVPIFWVWWDNLTQWNWQWAWSLWYVALVALTLADLNSCYKLNIFILHRIIEYGCLKGVCIVGEHYPGQLEHFPYPVLTEEDIKTLQDRKKCEYSNQYQFPG